jgi:ketosteroid isomerase-like protein
VLSPSVSTLATLAQRSPPSPAPEPLPEPRFERMFLESPTLPTVILAVAAIAILLAFNARGQLKKGLVIAALLAALAAGLWALALGITTDRQHVKAATESLVRAVAEVDAAELDRLMAPDCLLYHVYAPRGVPKSAAIADVQQYMRGILAVREHRILDNQAVLDGPNLARSQVNVRATLETWGVPQSGWFLLHWRRADDGQWRVFEIRPLRRELAAR